jgi:putative ABC transport system permease protein
MLANFFNTSIRILVQNKTISLINIFSLTIGITAFILIILYVHNELTYDKFNENYGRIYRLEADDWGKIPPISGDFIKEEIPGIENLVRLTGGGFTQVSYFEDDKKDDEKIIEINFLWADSTLFDVFSFPFITGDPSSSLQRPFSIVLTRTASRMIFGETDPLGQTLEIDKNQYIVTGIINDIKKSHLDFDALISRETVEVIYPGMNVNYGRYQHLWTVTYLLLNENQDKKIIEDKINSLLKRLFDEDVYHFEFDHFFVRPLKDIYLKGVIKYDWAEHGSLKLLNTFLAIGIFILALACINYINLTTARASLRAKEVAMKKVLGSSKAILRNQFIIESVLITIPSFLLSLLLVQLFLNKFNQLAMIDINLSDYNQPLIWFYCLAGIILIGTLSGIYPAYYLTSIKSITLMRGGTVGNSRKEVFRKLLTIFQYIISVIMIISVLTNRRQLHYLRNTDLGFNKEQIINLMIDGSQASKETFKERLLRYPDIIKVAYSNIPIGEELAETGGLWEIEDFLIRGSFLRIDPDYFALMGVQIKDGRTFSWDRLGDRFNREVKLNKFGIIVNETWVNELGLENPVGKIGKNPMGRQFEIIGVVHDFHFQSLHHRIEPTVFIWEENQSSGSIKISPDNVSATLATIQKEWKMVFGSSPFIYEFLDDSLYKQYKQDEQIARIIGYFTILAILIASLGLFSLSSFILLQRKKEIAIRKILGASTWSIFIHQSQEFLKWVALSVIIGSPIAWYLMNKWLQGFANKINLGFDIFIIAAFIALLIALITVAWQSFKTASADPVDVLRNE